MHILNKVCSGKVECNYNVRELLQESEQPCDEIKPYLEASYECLHGKCYRPHEYVYLCATFLIEMLPLICLDESVSSYNVMHNVTICYLQC